MNALAFAAPVASISTDDLLELLVYVVIFLVVVLILLKVVDRI